MSEKGAILRLPSAMQQALDAYAPGFVPWSLEDYTAEGKQVHRFDLRQALFGVVADFNGDGIIDAALEGYNSKEEFFFVILSDGASFRIVELMERRPLYYKSRAKPSYLLLQPPGVIQGPEEIEPKALHLATAAIHWVYDGQASMIYYWKGGGFQTYITGD